VTPVRREAKVRCPDCPKSFSPTYLPQHRRDIHKKFIRPARTKRAAELVPVPAPVVNGSALPTFVRMSPALMLEDQDGHIWIAERLR
jgi:hypothetical protein